MADAERDDTAHRRLGVRELRGNLSGFLREAQGGRSFLILAHNEVLAEIRPPPARTRARRRPGALRGQISMEPDFDTLPPDVIAAMEGEAE